jgi:hypothetical protein
MMQWWNNATIRAFRERTQCIIDQYSRYKIDEVGLYVNGRMTQGENIADNGGLKQSFRVNCRFWCRRAVVTLFAGVQEVGVPARRGARPARAQSDPRPALLPQLRPDLVRLDAAGGRPHQGQVERALPRTHQGAGAAIQLVGFRQRLRMSARLAHESD